MRIALPVLPLALFVSLCVSSLFLDVRFPFYGLDQHQKFIHSEFIQMLFGIRELDAHLLAVVSAWDVFMCDVETKLKCGNKC